MIMRPCYIWAFVCSEINKPEESSELFTRIVAAEDADPALKSAAAEYLEN